MTSIQIITGLQTVHVAVNNVDAESFLSLMWQRRSLYLKLCRAAYMERKTRWTMGIMALHHNIGWIKRIEELETEIGQFDQAHPGILTLCALAEYTH